MTDDGEIVGGTPGAQRGLGDGYFNYSPAAWSRIDAALGQLSSDRRMELRFIASSFLKERTRKEEFDARARRHAHHNEIAEAAQRLLDVSDAEGCAVDPLRFHETLRSQLEDLAFFHRRMAQYEREEAPHNAAKPDKAFFLYRLCAFWEHVTGALPAVAFRQKLSGNYLLGEKYGPAVDFLVSAGTDPCLEKGHKAVTPDVAAAAISAYCDPIEAEAIRFAHGKSILDDLTDMSGQKKPDMGK